MKPFSLQINICKFEKTIKMEALKLKGRAENGLLTVAVPAAFNDTELDVIVLHEEKKQLSDEKRIKALLSIIGAAKDKDQPYNKHEAYNQ